MGACSQKQKLKFNPRAGVTLIELLIATSITAIIVGALATIGVSVMQAQTRANAMQALQDDLRFALGVAGKEIRLAQVVKGGTALNCIPSQGDSYQFTASSLRFLNDKGECVLYRYDSANQTLCRDVDKNLSDGVSFPALSNCSRLISDSIRITDFQLTVTGQDQADKQPRVTVSLQAQSRLQPAVSVGLQITLTQRELDVLKR